MNMHEVEFKDAKGAQHKLRDYRGKVVLVVNVASKCGLTPQYEGLQKLYSTYRAQGFEILGFPANEFGAQEPGSNAEIQSFCQSNFGVEFPVFEKIVVKGEGQHSLYRLLTQSKPEAYKKPGSQLEKKLAEHGLLSGKPGDIVWNFEKFLLSRQGKVVARFAPDIDPFDHELTVAIEKELSHD